METININNNEYVLMPADYIDTIKDAEPIEGMFSIDASIHIKNVGKIICYAEMNDDFNIYEPVSNEYELDAVYDYLDKQVDESAHEVITANMLKAARAKAVDPLVENRSKGFLLFKKLNESIEEADDQLKDEAFERILAYKTKFKAYYDNVGISRADDEYCANANKMQEYIEKGSNPNRIAGACKNNINKLVYRYAYLINNRKDLTDWIELFKDAIKTYVYSHNDWDTDFRNIIAKIKAEREEKAKFEDEVINSDTSKFAPKARDWEKMIDYMNRKSVPQRLADSCKDSNKVVARFIIANSLGWNECAEAFKERALTLGVATPAELEAYARKYATAGMPEEYAELVQDIKSNDLKGGLAMQDDLDYSRIPRYVTKALDDCNDIVKYKIHNMNDRYLIINATTSNDSEITFDLTPSYNPRAGKFAIRFIRKGDNDKSYYYNENIAEFREHINSVVNILM